MALPQRDVALLLAAKPLPIPTLSSTASRSKSPRNSRIVQAHAFIFALGHDVQKRFQRRTRGFDAAVLEIVQRHAPLRLDDGVHAGGKQFEALLFRPQHFLGENHVRRFEKPAEETVDKQST